MANVQCHVIYVDRSVSRDRSVRASRWNRDGDAIRGESAHMAENVRLLLDAFDEVHLCSTGAACLDQWLSLQEPSMAALKPTLFILDTPYQDEVARRDRSRSPSPSARIADSGNQGGEELYGLALLRRIVSESYVRNVSKLVVTVPIIAPPYCDRSDGGDGTGEPTGRAVADNSHQLSADERRAANRRMWKKCLEVGAADVMTNPMNPRCVSNLEVHAYRAQLDAARDQKALVELRRGRKRSWVGICEEKPFSYLREAMVSKLMGRICRIGSEAEEVAHSIKLSITPEKQAQVTSAVGQWHFCAHDFTEDELLVAASVMFEHALSMPELEPWRIPTDQLHHFLLACRAAYNTFVPYHNFRHVVDVLQATFHFLVSIGSLPPYRSPDGSLLSRACPKSPVAQLLQPFEALTLLITAIGHDVGHPGVNNGFLVTLNAPLAQLYNDRSVLESFHCAAYSQILRRYWPSAFGDSKMRHLMISSILATDMGLHFDYMKKLGDLQAKLHANNSTEDWEESVKNEQRALTCALLIKCADISNVTRRHDAALQWMRILSEEFSRQASMESELEIKTSLMSEPKQDTLSLTTAQLKFMNLFALPLFQGVADILPAMQYCVDELHVNKELFDKCLLDEQKRQSPAQPVLRDHDSELSIRSIKFTSSPEPATEVNPARGAIGSVPKVVEPQTPDPAVSQQADFHRPNPHPKRPTDGRIVNGIVTSFSSANESGHGEDASMNGGASPRHGHTRQRCSEMTDGGSAPNSGDWASQATSATTGRMPLSPSTKGTSIVSCDSFERPLSYSTSVPVPSVVAPDESTTTVPDSATTTESHTDFKLENYQPPPLLLDEENDAPRNGHQQHNQYLNGGSVKKNDHGGAEPADPGARQLKKKPSRFRINGLQNLFRKHKSSSPPMQAADTAG
ncbi:uncharacterized protein P884DRAFT_295756 [Thermothelomyces heterothallicus CBS 202.75]|uniref:uncharacterized protein n=1 Tax=Thermothelomyces heterothallicus CBS 202.75 TaxID=1149848 RepID=UPI00374425DE